MKNKTQNKNIIKKDNNNQIGKLIVRISLILLLLFNLVIVTTFADTKSDILGVIENNYLASQEGNVDAYIKTMDTHFLDISSPENFSYKNYFSGTFEVIKTLDYKINEPTFELMPNSALVFYNLKATLKNKETNENKKIDNDVVTFLWNYNGKWKIRWTLTQSLYQFKAEAGLLSDVAVDMTLENLDKITLKQKAIDKGVYVEQKDELLVDDENRDKVNSNYNGDVSSIANNDEHNSNDLDNNNDDSSINWFWVFIFSLVVYFIFFRKKKEKKNKKQKSKKENKPKENKPKRNVKKDKVNKTSFVQKFLGRMYVIQEQLKKKEQNIDKKTGTTKAQRDVDKYYRDKMFEEDLNKETVVVDSSDDNDDYNNDDSTFDGDDD